MNIFCSNVSFKKSESDLKDLFSDFGVVDRCKIVLDKDTGKSRGFAFVEMPNSQEAKAAIAGLNQTTVADREISCNEAREFRRRVAKRWDEVLVRKSQPVKGDLPRWRYASLARVERAD